MSSLLTKIKLDLYYMVKGFKLIFFEDLPEIKEKSSIDEEHQRLLQNIKLVKNQKLDW
jgi:hypothetical protein